MQSKYYYLVATLPYLKLEEKPKISGEAFLLECEKWLAPEDMQAVRSADIHCIEDGCEQAALLKEWKEFDEGLREELASIRAAGKKGQSQKMRDELKSVMEQENPLLMEKVLEKVRWDFLEDKKFKYNFDINWLIVYFLELQILERIAEFDKDKGESLFYELCEVKYE